MLKNILILLFICNFYSKHSRAQGGFIKRHDIAGYDNPYYTTIIASDTCYWAFGIIWDTTPPYFAGTAIYKFDLLGNLIKQKDFLSKKDFYGFNKDMYFYKDKIYTSVLNPYSTSSIIGYDIASDSFQVEASSINLLPDGDFLGANNLYFDQLGNCYIANSVASLVSTNSFTQIQLIKFNSNFERKWTKILGNPVIDEIPYSIRSDSNNNIIVGGQRIKLNYMEGDQSYSRSIFYKLSPDGDLIKETVADKLSGAVYDFCIDDLGNYICASEVLLPYHPQFPFNYPAFQKLDTFGTVLYREYFEEVPKADYPLQIFNKIKFHEKRKLYYCVGTIVVIDDDLNLGLKENRVILVCFDTSGKLLWKRIFKTVDATEGALGNDFDFTHDGGIIICGLSSAAGVDSISQWTSLLIKVDSNGCIMPDCQLSSNSDSRIKDTSIKIYPNPASDYVVLLHSGTEETNYQIFSLDGKILNKFSSYIEGEQIIISLSNYSAGSYLIRATYKNDLTETKLFIKK